jgi:uncharacterized protein YqjF (DUF2071 family)
MTLTGSLLSMRWRDVLFASWPVAPTAIRPQLPDGLDPDTFEGDAYLSVVAFVMEDIRPRGSPVGLTFPELNLRTYVTHEDGPGIYFFNLDADDRVGVSIARRAFGLPYYTAEMSVSERDEGFRFRSQRTDSNAPRADFDATYAPTGEHSRPEPGTLEHFLTERYRFYTPVFGRLFRGDIQHDPWQIAPATASFEANGLFDANGVAPPTSDPHCLYSQGIDVAAGRIRRATESDEEPGIVSGARV